jgi:hypothetical protein
MKKIVILAIILAIFGAYFASYAEMTGVESSETVKKIVEADLSRAKKENKLMAPYQNGDIFFYKDYLIVYIPYLKKWTTVPYSDLQDVAVAPNIDE